MLLECKLPVIETSESVELNDKSLMVHVLVNFNGFFTESSVTSDALNDSNNVSQTLCGTAAVETPPAAGADSSEMIGTGATTTLFLPPELMPPPPPPPPPPPEPPLPPDDTVTVNATELEFSCPDVSFTHNISVLLPSAAVIVVFAQFEIVVLLPDFKL